jgi:hypothetical protein
MLVLARSISTTLVPLLGYRTFMTLRLPLLVLRHLPQPPRHLRHAITLSLLLLLRLLAGKRTSMPEFSAVCIPLLI